MRVLFTLLLAAIVARGSAQKIQPIGSGVFHWNDFPVEHMGDREGRKILVGSTYLFNYFTIHATTQQKGAVPKAAHAHKDLEELIIIKEGKMKCTIGNKTAELGAGSVILIPPQESQVFENTGDGPLTYYVLMFRADSMNIERSRKAGGALLINYDSLTYTEKGSRGTRKYFERPTAMCSNYEMHTTYLKEAGPSHAPHQHPDTEIILIIDGQVAMDIDGVHYTGGPGDFFIAESGKMHGVINNSEKPCSYFAFKWR